MGNTARTGSNGAEEILQEIESAHGPEWYTKKYRSARKEEGAEYDYCRHPAGCSNNRDLRCESPLLVLDVAFTRDRDGA